MLIKRLFVPGIVLCLLISTAKASEKFTDTADSMLIHELADQANHFESQFYDSGKIDITYPPETLGIYDQLIDYYASLASQYPDSNFDAKSFMYLEKKKNLKILSLLNDGYSETDTLNENGSIINILNDSTAVSIFGRKLFSLMKQPVDISDLQKNFLDDIEVILDFWVKDNKISVFMLTRDSLHTIQWNIPIDQLKMKMNLLLSPFYNNAGLLPLEFDYQISYQVYQLLFQPLEKYTQNYKTIYIIPDGFLVGFPFELLVRDPTVLKKQNEDIIFQDYSQLDFLIKKYAICYNYSTAILASGKDLDRTTKKLGRRLLTLSEPIPAQNTGEILKLQANLSSQLPEMTDYTADEIKRVSRLLFRHDNLKKEQVTKAFLFENGRRYRWLYFALPGILNNSNPLNSGLLFTRQSDDTSGLSDWLTPIEITQMKLAADLLTLSDTQVQSFSTDGNPGVIALPESFLFSGVKSVLFSLWRVNSISTSQFMSKFYWELKYKRQTNVAALREAKIASLKDTFTLDGKKISRAHPYFWATFQLIGDPKIRPPSPTRLPPWGVIVIVYVCVILGTLFITRKTMPDRKK
jgi:CHAT domain-containing protein